jgi:hypothetical protein
MTKIATIAPVEMYSEPFPILAISFTTANIFVLYSKHVNVFWEYYQINDSFDQSTFFKSHPTQNYVWPLGNDFNWATLGCYCWAE